MEAPVYKNLFKPLNLNGLRLKNRPIVQDGEKKSGRHIKVYFSNGISVFHLTGIKF